MIAITTSNSISVNADQNFFVLIFIVGFFSCSCSEGFIVVAEIDDPGAPIVSEGFWGLFWGFWFRLLFGLFPGFWSENGGAYRRLHR